MEEIKILDEFFFSAVLGMKIYDSNGKKIGELKDIAVTWNEASPIITCLKYGKDSAEHIGVSLIREWTQTGIILNVEDNAIFARQLNKDEIYVGRWLMDKQIIDLNGSKLVRVNDIQLLWVQHGNCNEIIMSAIDIGVNGLLRRLGLKFFTKNRPNQLLGWQYFTPLEKKIGNLHIKEDFVKLQQIHPADIADIIEDLGHDYRNNVLKTMNTEKMADVIAEMDFEAQVQIITEMDAARASDILEEMPADDAADILGELEISQSNEIITLMNPEDAEDMRELMSYKDGTAGALMTTGYLSFPAQITVEETIQRLRELAEDTETIYYIYVIDEHEILQGVLSLRELIVAQPNVVLTDLMHTKLRSVDVVDDDKKALDLVMKYNLLAVPVLNSEKQIQGIITVDDLLRIIVPDRSEFKTFSHYMLSARKRH